MAKSTKEAQQTSKSTQKAPNQRLPSKDWDTSTILSGKSLGTKSYATTRSSYKDELIETLIVIPPDGGWGWVVVMASFFCNFIADGTMYSFGIFLQDISDSLHSTTTEISLCNSVMTGVYYLSGPLVGALTNRFGFRVVGVIGGLITCTAFVVSTFCNTLVLLVLCYGIIGGVGFGMIYLPSIIVVGFYFERWRALATSIAVCGSSLGIMAFPPIMEDLLKDFGWKTKFHILAGLALFCAFCGILYRPLQPVKIVVADDKKSAFSSRQGSVGSLYYERKSTLSQIFRGYHNAAYPTTADLIGKSQITLCAPRRASTSSFFIASTSASRASIRTSKSLKQSLGVLYEYDENEEELGKCTICCRRCRTSECCYSNCCLDENITASRPMYRDDIFYSASVENLPQYTKPTIVNPSQKASAGNKKSAIDYHMSVTRALTQRDIEEDYGPCTCCPQAMIRPLATMLNFGLLKSPSFLLLAFSGLLTVLGLYVPYTYIMASAISHGVKEEIAFYLISTIGLANTIGRIISGIVSSIPNVKTLEMSYICILLAGTTTAFCSFFAYSTIAQFSYAAIFGLTIACFTSLRPIIIVDMLGLEALTNAFGLLMLFQGFASLAGLPIAGVLKDWTGNYSAAFYFSGCVIVLSAILLIPISKVSKWEKKKLQIH